MIIINTSRAGNVRTESTDFANQDLIKYELSKKFITLTIALCIFPGEAEIKMSLYMLT